MFCTYAYACDNCAAQRIQIRVKGIATELYNVLNEKWAFKPLYTTRNETVFEVFSEPGTLHFYGIRWAENRDGEAIEVEVGSAPHDFED